MKNLKREIKAHRPRRPLAPSYHSGKAHLHDTQHSGKAHLHDTQHSGKAHLHDTQHSGKAHLHDTQHSGKAHLHDTQHVFSGTEHGNAHIINVSISPERDGDRGSKTDHHMNHSLFLANEVRPIGVNDGYFYRGFVDYPQRGYLRFSDQGFDNHLLFVNNFRHHTVDGEAERQVYFQIRKVPLVISRNTVEIYIANNFDVVPHFPIAPIAREWNSTGWKFTSNESVENEDKLSLENDLTDAGPTINADYLGSKSRRKRVVHKIRLHGKIKKSFGYLKLDGERLFKSDETPSEIKSDAILFVSELPKLLLFKKTVKFELRLVPLIIADNTVEIDVAYFRGPLLLRILFRLLGGFERLFPPNSNKVSRKAYN